MTISSCQSRAPFQIHRNIHPPGSIGLELRLFLSLFRANNEFNQEAMAAHLVVAAVAALLNVVNCFGTPLLTGKLSDVGGAIEALTRFCG